MKIRIKCTNAFGFKANLLRFIKDRTGLACVLLFLLLSITEAYFCVKSGDSNNGGFVGLAGLLVLIFAYRSYNHKQNIIRRLIQSGVAWDPYMDITDDYVETGYVNISQNRISMSTLVAVNETVDSFVIRMQLGTLRISKADLVGKVSVDEFRLFLAKKLSKSQ